MKIQKVGPKAKRPQKKNKKKNIPTHPLTMPQAAGKNVFSGVIIQYILYLIAAESITPFGCWKVIDKCIHNMICQGVCFLGGYEFILEFIKWSGGTFIRVGTLIRHCIVTIACYGPQ